MCEQMHTLHVIKLPCLKTWLNKCPEVFMTLDKYCCPPMYDTVWVAKFWNTLPASTFRAEQFCAIKLKAYMYLHNVGIYKPDCTVSYIKIQPPVSSTIMHVSLLQTCNTKIDEQVNVVCITQNSHPHVGYYTPSEKLDDRPNLFWYDHTFIMQLSKMQGLTRTQILNYSRSDYIDYTRAVHKETEFFFSLLLYLQLNQTCLLQSTPLHSRYTTPQRFFQFWNVFCGMARRSHIEFSISSTIWNRLSFSEDLNFGNKKKSTGAKSGEYGGWGTTVVSCFVENSWIRSDTWPGALSWCSIQVLFVQASGLFLCTASLKCFRTFRKNSIDCLTTWNKLIMNDTLPIKKLSTSFERL